MQSAPLAKQDTLFDRRVRQANALARSGQQLHVIEKRLILITMARIMRDDTELLTHRIPMTELEPSFGGNPYRAANRAATGLLKRIVTIKEEDGGYTAFNWTTLARYVPGSKSDNGQAYIEIRLNEELKPYLLELKERFNSISLTDLLPMSSTNSQRLYEILWHDSHAGIKKVLTYQLSELKFSLGLRERVEEKGKVVWKEKYRQWRDFQKVLSRAQDDFKEYGRLRFSFEGIRKGKLTEQVRFSLSREDAKELETEVPLDEEAKKVSETLETLGYLQDTKRTLLNYGTEIVKAAIELAKEAERKASQTRNPVSNLGGLIHHILEQGLAERALERQTKQDEARDLEATARQLLDAYESAKAAWADERWEAMSQNDKSDFMDLMRVELSDMQLRILDKNEWQGSSFELSRRLTFLSLYAQELPEDLGDLEAYAAKEDLVRDLPEKDRLKLFALALSL